MEGKMKFNEFLQVFDAYRKYLGMEDVATPAPAPAPAPEPKPEPKKLAPSVDGGMEAIMQSLTAINEKLAKTPVPTAQEVQPVGVGDIIAKMF
ncbi:MAG: hypothetical protein IJ382_03010 [Flavobacteriales bacterium]|nr:hypothetical protein [Flavobacteriales bacterium]